MDKLIINTSANANYSNVICAFIRAGFSVNRFTINNDLLIVEIGGHAGVKVSNCDYAMLLQSIYEIVTLLGIDNITMQRINDAVAPCIANCDKSTRAAELAKCRAIVRAEQLAEDIAFKIHFYSCKKRVYKLNRAQYDAVTLCKTLAQLGLKSHIASNTLYIA